MRQLSTITGHKAMVFAALCVVLVYPLFVALSHDITRSYTVTPDADILYLSEALRFLDGLRQTYLDHPGHTYMMVLGLWLEMTALLGLTPEPSHAIAVHTADIDGYIQSLTVSARFLSAFMACLFTGLVIWGCRQLGVRLWIAWVGGLLFSTSVGIAATSLLLRAELWSAFFTVACFLSLISADTTAGRKQLLFLIAAGVAAMLAMESKIQAIIPLLGIPLLILVGTRTLSAPPVIARRLEFSAFRLFAVAAIVPLFSLWTMAYLNGYQAVAWPYSQVLALVYLLGCIFLYGHMRRHGMVHRFDGTLALLVGVAIGTYVLFFWYTRDLLHILVFPIEYMVRFSRAAGTHGFSFETLLFLLQDFARRGVRDPYYSSFLVNCLAVGFVVWLAKDGKRWPAIFVASMLGFSIAVTFLFGLRGFPDVYGVYTQVWAIFAFALGLEMLIEKMGRPVRVTGIALLTLVVGLNVNAGLDGKRIPQQPGDLICKQSRGYLAPELSVRFSKYCH